MEIFGYIKTELDMVISFGYQYIGLGICGYKTNGDKDVFLGIVKNNGKIIIPLSIFYNFNGLKLNDKKIELIKDK